MSPDKYRYYCLDSRGQLHDAEWFHAETDEDAVAYVEAKHANCRCEIWRDRRLIASLPINRLSASA